MGFLTGFALENLVAPLAAETFLDVHWDTLPLIENRYMPDFYDGLLDLETIDRLLVAETAPVAPSSVRNADRRKLAPLESQNDINGALTRMEQGAAMILNNVERRVPALGRVCRVLHADLGFRCAVEIMATMPGNKPLPAAARSTGMFVLQLEGSRRWSIGSRRIASPPLSDDAVEVEISGDDMEAVVNRGDLLYVPRGWPARHFSTGEISVQVCVRVHAPTWLDVVGPGGAEPGHGGSGAMADLLPVRWLAMPRERLAAELSRRWPQGGDAIAALAAIEQMVEAEVRRFPVDTTGRLSAMLKPKGITAQTIFAARDDLLWLTKPNNGSVRLISGPLTIDAPANATAALEFCLTERRYTAEQMPGRLSTDERIALVDRLVRNALITRVSP